MHKLRRGYLFHEDRIMDEHCGIAINKALQDPVLIGQHRDVRFDDFVGFPSHVRLIATAIIVGCLDDCGDTYGVRCSVINVGQGCFDPDRLLIFVSAELALSKLLL